MGGAVPSGFPALLLGPFLTHFLHSGWVLSICHPREDAPYHAQTPTQETPSGTLCWIPCNPRLLEASAPCPSQGSPGFQVLFPSLATSFLLWPDSNLTFRSQLGYCFPSTLPPTSCASQSFVP